MHGGAAKKKKAGAGGSDEVNEEKKLALETMKLGEIYSAVVFKFPRWTKETANWKTLVNIKLNDRLGSLNRFFKEVKLNHRRPDDEKTSEYHITKDDEHLLADFKEAISDPDFFYRLDEEIEEIDEA